MDVQAVTTSLAGEFPGKPIIYDTSGKPVTEIVVELERDDDQSVAIAIIDETPAHWHAKATEVYEIEKGTLEVVVGGSRHTLSEGDRLEIRPGVIHSARGNQTRVRATCSPPWTPEDHILA